MPISLKYDALNQALVVTDDNEASVSFSRDESENYNIGQAGFIAAVAEISHSLSISKLSYGANITSNGYFRTGVDNLLWREIFNHTIVQNDIYYSTVSVMTVGISGGFLVINSGNSVAANASARIQSWRSFELFGLSTLIVIYRVKFSQTPVSGNYSIVGIGITTTPTPTQGVYFQLAPTGGPLKGTVCFNGVEQTVQLATTPMSGVVYELRLRIDEDIVQFFVNGVLEGSISRNKNQPSFFLPRAAQLLMSSVNRTATSVAQRLEIAEITVYQTDTPMIRDSGGVAASSKNHSSSVPRGVATGQSANYTNSTEPVNASLSNTVAGYTTIGGQFSFLTVSGAVTDFALFVYAVPASVVTSSNRNLFINAITIDLISVGAAGSATPTVMQWALGLGSTATSLATAYGTGTRAPCRIPLGMLVIPGSAPIGTKPLSKIDVTFGAPIMVEPNTNIHIICRIPVGAATASQVIRGIVRIDGYFE